MLLMLLLIEELSKDSKESMRNCKETWSWRKSCNKKLPKITKLWSMTTKDKRKLQSILNSRKVPIMLLLGLIKWNTGKKCKRRASLKDRINISKSLKDSSKKKKRQCSPNPNSAKMKRSSIWTQDLLLECKITIWIHSYLPTTEPKRILAFRLEMVLIL